MVTEARRKSSQCLDAALLALSHLAAVTGIPLNAVEGGPQDTGKVTSPLTAAAASTSATRCSSVPHNATFTSEK